jgi:hypothetical protein
MTFSRYAHFVTSGIPQMLHEFCLELAFVAEDAGTAVNPSMLDKAAIAWLQSSLTSSYTAVEDMMNERNTVIARRNQVLYALAQITRDEFGYLEIEDIVRDAFPASTTAKNLNISQLLTS